MTFDEHLQRYQAWLEALEDAPGWSRVVFVDAANVHGPASPVEISRDQLLSPEQFETVFERYIDGRYAWINLECLGVMDDTLFLACSVSAQGPADPATVLRERIAVNFSGPDNRWRWDARGRIRIV